MSSYKQRRFQQNVAFLSKFFNDTKTMKGIIIKINPEQPYRNYVKAFGDPQTLQLTDDDDNILSFYKADDRTPVRNIMKGVIVLTSYVLTENNFIRIPLPPADVPKRLEEHIFPDLVQKYKKMQLKDVTMPIEAFLNKHYVHGSMTSLSNMKAKPGWHKSFRDNLEIKQVHICKSCNNKARKGCCDKYGTNNRKTLYMVLGWSERD